MNTPQSPSKTRMRCGAAALALAALLGGCGGADESAEQSAEQSSQAQAFDFDDSAHTALAQQLAGDASARAAVLDADTVLSSDGAARQAADARGAPGDGEVVVHLVRARRPADAHALVRELEGRGFGPLFVLP